MRTIDALVAGAALLSVAACRTAPLPLSESDRAAARSTDSAFAAAATAGQLDGIMAAYAPGAIVMPPGMGMAAGHAAVRELFGPMLAAGRMRLELTTGTIDGAGDVMYATGSYVLQALPSDTTQPMPPAEHGKYLEVFRKQADGSWKMVRDAWSPDASPPAPAPPAPRARGR